MMKENKMKKHFIRLMILFAVSAACSGCCTRASVTAGLSPKLKDYYSIYPSVEVDIAALSAAEADEIRALGVEDYFAVGNETRKNAMPYTLSFSSEETEPQTMKRGADAWDAWMEKNPEKIVVVANLPRGTGKKSLKTDPRIQVLDLKSRFLIPRHFYFEIMPGRIVEVQKKPKDPEYETKKLKAAQEKSKQKNTVKR